MTELYIDGTEVILPQDFSVQVKRENPLVTKNGEYTYDITLPLDNPVNAALYKHLNRLNSVREIEEKRTAILIADNRVYCNGTEVITGWTEDTVSLQIVSGNSELNYFIGSSLMISFLNMPNTVPGVPDSGETMTEKEKLLHHVECTYPEVDYCLAPLADNSTGNIINRWCIKYDSGHLNPRIDTDDLSDVYPMPYLCAYIREVLAGIGYELTQNQLESSVFKELYLCHTEYTCEWNRMLPGWSVQDFLEQVERLFNVTFVIDSRKRTTRLLFRATYFQDGTTIHITQTEDEYEAETEDADMEDATVSNVEYNLPDEEFWQWHRLSDSVKKAAKYVNIPVSYTPTKFERIREWFTDAEHQRTDTIYRDLLDGRQYLFLYDNSGTLQRPAYAMVDDFACLEREDADDTVSLEIIPVMLERKEINTYESGTDWAMASVKLYIPSLGGNATDNEEESEEETASLVEMIQNGTTEASASKGNIHVAFYSGTADVYAIGGYTYPFPRPYIDEYILFDGLGYRQYLQTNGNGASLRLTTMDSLCYQGNHTIRYDRTVSFLIRDSGMYDPQAIFEIRNRYYICKEMEFTLDCRGRKGAWTGVFYPLLENPD